MSRLRFRFQGEAVKFQTAFVALILLTVAGASGCQFIGLQGDLDRLDSASRLPIEVIGLPGESSPRIVVILTPVKVGLTVLNYAVLPRSGKVSLPVASGKHYVVAFHDRNGNLRFDDGEPGARFGEPTLIDLKPGETHSQIKLRLTAEGGQADQWPENFRKRAKTISLQPYLPVIGEVVTLEDPRFDQSVVEQGLWSPADFLIAGGKMGIYFVAKYDPAKPVVLLVHGINGSPRELAPLVEVAQDAGYQPWLFYYPSALRLGDLSTALMRSILTAQAVFKPQGISMLAYSMGGLVAHDALDKLSQNDLVGDGVVSIESQRQVDIVNRATQIDQIDANHKTVLTHSKTQRTISAWLNLNSL